LNYDRQLGRFRGWLLTVARSKLSNLVARRKRQPQGSGDTDLHESLQSLPSSPEDETYWDAEYDGGYSNGRPNAFALRVQQTTWQAFWQTAVDNQDVKDVAEKLVSPLGLSISPRVESWRG
jgi:RNA polymerase sigma-70 factor (ECF subfamily)